MGQTLRIVNYAVNGAGVGHLTRLTAISRWLRRYAHALDIKLEIWFLTSSEADALLFHERFASFKLPSKTSVAESGIDKTAYLALAKQWVWHSLGLLRPDLFVVDSFPRGSFGELLPALDLCRKRAFIFRPMKSAFAERAEFQAMLPLYDRILVPESDAAVPVPDQIRARVAHVGPVIARERAELLPRDAARRHLGAPPDRLAVYLSAGGGGDPTAAAQLESTIAALAPDSSLHLVVGAGPLYRGRQIPGERITWLSGLGASELMAGLDIAVCAAGYNTFAELMQAGVPAVFLPQEKIADEQDARAAKAVAAEAAAFLPPGPLPETLPAQVDAWRDPVARRKASAAAHALMPGNGARLAAAELLRLLLPAAQVETAEAMVGDGILRAAAELNLPETLFVDMAQALNHDHGHDRVAPDADPAVAGAGAIEIAADAAGRGLPVEAVLRAVVFLAKRLPGASPHGRIDAARRLVEAAAPFGDWAGLIALLKMFGNERADAVGFTAELCAFLGHLLRRKEDLYRGIARLTACQPSDGAPVSNVDLVRAAMRSMT
ncbi:MAG TPA: glycosyltransferase [Candidatus Ozemobacteraceae bacterium]|nr:glycosyltransferase [Candidatus Ozemobacteraceae bacterium]